MDEETEKLMLDEATLSDLRHEASDLRKTVKRYWSTILDLQVRLATKELRLRQSQRIVKGQAEELLSRGRELEQAEERDTSQQELIVRQMNRLRTYQKEKFLSEEAT